MMLGQLIADLENEAVAEEALLALGDLVLIAGVNEIAARDNASAGTVVAAAIGSFIGTAGPEAWMSAMRAASDSPSPGAACLRVMLQHTIGVAAAPGVQPFHAESGTNGWCV